MLGLASDGHLVVAELKKDMAPDTVEMQAIKYAAMASRFTADVLADAYAKFRRAHHGETLTSDEALEALSAHGELGSNDEALRAPRIVLVAGGFPPNVTATAVWLSEMGLDITLVRIQAYKTAEEVVVTVSQHYPPPEVEDFIVIPKPPRSATPRLPVIDWTAEDLRLLATEVHNVTIRATMDLCAATPDTWIAASTIRSATGKEPASQRGDFGGFGITLKSRFKRSNPPYDDQWAAGETNEVSYKLSREIAELWRAAMEGNTSVLVDAPESQLEGVAASSSSDGDLTA